MVNGILGDRMPPRPLVALGLILSALVNVCMGFGPGAAAMGALWAVNGFGLSMIWPPLVRVIAENFDEETRIRYSVHITTTVPCGTIASYLISALMLKCGGWRPVFWAAAAVLLCAAALWLLLYRRAADRAGTPVVKQAAELTREPFLRHAMAPVILIMLVPIIAHGAIKDGVTAWVPTYISEVFSTEPALSVLLSALLPVANLAGAYLSQFAMRRWFRSEIRTSGFFFLIATIALAALPLLSGAGVIPTVFLLCVITSSMLAVNTMLISLAPLHYGKYGCASTMSGFLNSVAYAGAALSMASTGYLVDGAGWGAAIASWIALCCGGFLFCIFGRKFTFK